MEIDKILNPKGWLIGLGVFVLLFSVSGVMDPESVAEMGWGDFRHTIHDRAHFEKVNPESP